MAFGRYTPKFSDQMFACRSIGGVQWMVLNERYPIDGVQFKRYRIGAIEWPL